MLNIQQKLNQNIFKADCEKKFMRAGFGEGLSILGDREKKVVALTADLTDSTFMTSFKAKYGDRFFNVGVAEQNLITVASGMARMGKIPFVSSYAVFSPGRNWEEIRTTICLNNVPVKIIGSHAGVSVGPDGGSHQALEDIALMRVLPHMVVISPCDALEAKKATIEASKTNTPVYIRLSRDSTDIITTEDTPFEIGKIHEYWRSHSMNKKEHSPSPDHKGFLNPHHARGFTGVDVSIFATGHLLSKALRVAKKVTEEGKGVVVYNMNTIKPLDEHTVIKAAHESHAIVTVEEHQINGGMGSCISECLSRHYPVPIEFIGVKDLFGQSGKPDELIEHYEMGEKHIYNAVQRVLLRKK
jgi:transketolase